MWVPRTYFDPRAHPQTHAHTFHLHCLGYLTTMTNNKTPWMTYWAVCLQQLHVSANTVIMACRHKSMRVQRIRTFMFHIVCQHIFVHYARRPIPCAYFRHGTVISAELKHDQISLQALMAQQSKALKSWQWWSAKRMHLLKNNKQRSTSLFGEKYTLRGFSGGLVRWHVNIIISCPWTYANVNRGAGYAPQCAMCVTVYGVLMATKSTICMCGHACVCVCVFD